MNYGKNKGGFDETAILVHIVVIRGFAENLMSLKYPFYHLLKTFFCKKM